MKYQLTTLLTFAFFLPILAQENSKHVFTLYTDSVVQQVRNIGASGCWFSEEIGKEWPSSKKQQIAQLLFSRDFDKSGNPKGIGLSAFRYNIGAGTTEQGDVSGIKDSAHRVECFLSKDGSYDWDKQQGYTWMLQQAKKYGVENLIAFVNSPPVQFTKNGLGFKLVKDSSTNLREDRYREYANFLAEVMKHFDKSNLHFNYVSPVNEPQWDWTGTIGSAKQEGSPWSNVEIYNTVKALDQSLSEQKLGTKILITEAGMLDHLYAQNVNASSQVANFWSRTSPLYIGNLKNTTKYVEGHGYFTENGDEYLIRARRSLRDTLVKYDSQLEFWQSEYCMLGDGFKEKTNKKRSAIDCALFLAKIIHHDFTVGNASAWHYWNSYEPGPSDSNSLYYLIAMNPARHTDTSNLYTVTKNLWALGHYSLFIRPGMYRIKTGRNDDLPDTAIAQQVMISAFKDSTGKKVVVNIINYTTEEQKANFVLKGLPVKKTMRLVRRYVTSGKEGEDLKFYPSPFKKVKNYEETNKDVALPARSISTLIFSS